MPNFTEFNYFSNDENFQYYTNSNDGKTVRRFKPSFLTSQYKLTYALLVELNPHIFSIKNYNKSSVDINIDEKYILEYFNKKNNKIKQAINITTKLNEPIMA